ncbi:MAG: peptidoglycan synthetase [Flavobacteriales bacterium]|jgi:UDP-N-acetylmuramate: L-alanyl-gamma-D-glutamyl-meso-diaminopimelate ligase|nr:peptidoglycan synthetase [Flavobacteriales bacterium]MBT3964118.1 peptidoglycan synthetase [Flavobacteriales bacterium]MBT4705779.1 peptidoglycan synthetase [Flavobacteriales bacterium]MBT4930224.1 peptidoglycan synthetase [Flavobacteriales bacterium]MBT5132447.1 peptidoglycan synthetase [Flavobacteriales bacterium]
MKIHFIAIGGAAMHNLAIALKQNGHEVTGSDDQIFEPSKSRLESHGILPNEFGWYPEKLSEDIDAVILGMHAREDNPELKRAQDLDLLVYSYPAFIYEQSMKKTRVVIGGSHGKTTITSMILHVLKTLGEDFDYLVGAQIEGFDTMVRLSDAPVIILEGDEYLSSPIDRRPKFHLYDPHIALISGIAWDHVNVFPTFDNYLKQFEIFVDEMMADGALIFCQADETLDACVQDFGQHLELIPYNTPEYEVEQGQTKILMNLDKIEVGVFGEHNLQNLIGAKLVCEHLGISEEKFFNAIADFKGAARRLEELSRNDSSVVYKDFAHSPSKLMATTKAVKAQWPDRHLVACMELHTFSSLTKEFLVEYNGAMDDADTAIVFYKKETIEQKRLEPISEQEVKAAFQRDDLMVFTNSQELQDHLQSIEWNGKNLLFMSSGNFGGIDVDDFGPSLI